MSYPDPRYLGNKGKISARYRAGSFSRMPLAPHLMQERVTPTQDLFVLCHLGVPQLEADAWSLTIDGLVAQPLSPRLLRLDRIPQDTPSRASINVAVVRCNPSSPLGASPTFVGAARGSPTSCETASRHRRRNTCGRMARTMESSAVFTTRLT